MTDDPRWFLLLEDLGRLTASRHEKTAQRLRLRVIRKGRTKGRSKDAEGATS